MEYRPFQHAYERPIIFMTMSDLEINKWTGYTYLGGGARLAFVLGGDFGFDASLDKVVDGHLRERMVEGSRET